MLKSWSIENFKPIVNSGELKLAPVTILAGRNSSGKSSLLQSILMIAQTLSNQVPDRALLPNERIVQLGTFEDILSDFSGSRTISVGFELEFETGQAPTSFDSDPFLENESDVTSVRTIAVFNSASGNGTSSAAIEAAKVVVEKVSMEINATQAIFIEIGHDRNFSELKREASDIKFSFTVDKLSDYQLSRFLEKVEADYLRFVPYSGEQPNYIGNFEYQNEKTHEPVLVALSHFLPTRLVRKFREEERRLRTLKTSLKRMVTRFLRATDDEALTELIQRYSNLFNPKTPISEEMRADIQKFCEDMHIVEEFSGQTILQLIVWANSLMRTIMPGSGKRTFQRSRKEISVITDELDMLLSQSIYNIGNAELQSHKGSEGLEIFVNDNEVENISQAVTKLTRFFTSKIRYLGPLRADPQASQKFAPSSELDDVGQKGEYSAAVYDANQEARIEWFNPFSKQIERGTLKVALDNWARYLDVANQIGIETAGQSGFSWQVVHKEGQKALPLSAVGVGVSQVLPILVMGLLAPANTLLIIEQPELHLHASVQARLGDFFVGLSKCKKQCVIETHSENLVSQLRYHIVQSGGQDKSDCIIYFVNQDENGAAKFEPVEISPQGNILNWPDGFFDETMLQEDRITAASIKRRANKLKNG
jgi:predicted ATPase